MEIQAMLNNLLISENVVENIKENLDDLIQIIPEIKDMIGFESKHPHHYLDVWEHTLYALSLSPNNFDIRLALLLHDIGKPHSYQEGEVRHFKGHPEKSKDISQLILRRFGYEEKYINYICEIISRHDIPLTKNDIFTNEEKSKMIFEVQKCDAMAHNPDKNKKRIEYIAMINEIFNEKEKNNENFSLVQIR